MSDRRFTLNAPSPPTNTLRLTVDASVDLQELATWPPATSRAFMIGLAQVLAAQKEEIAHAR